MEFQGFAPEDFEVFEVPGLEERMNALKRHLRPKLEQLGQDMSVFLADLLEQPVFAHVAKHARRTVNPPNDSWVAFCHDKRGYKKHPHFQIGAWGTHVFANFGMIYESPWRTVYAEQLKTHAREVVASIPSDYVWVPNHMDPNDISARDVDAEQLVKLADKLAKGRQGELLVGIRIDKQKAVRMDAATFEDHVKSCFQTLIPLYKMSMKEVILT